MTNQTAATRAPKGGISIMGTFYKGGQFLPTNEPQRGAHSRKAKTTHKPRKVEVAPYKWELLPEGQSAIYTSIQHVTKRTGYDTRVYNGNTATLRYIGMNEAQARYLIELYNEGEKFFWNGAGFKSIK